MPWFSTLEEPKSNNATRNNGYQFYLSDKFYKGESFNQI